MSLTHTRLEYEMRVLKEKGKEKKMRSEIIGLEVVRDVSWLFDPVRQLALLSEFRSQFIEGAILHNPTERVCFRFSSGIQG